MGAAADRIIGTLAGRQHGVVARDQLLAAGVSPHVLKHRLSEGLLVPLHRGVYRVGPVVAPHAREMAAVLACGERAVLSHRSAAGLWGLLPKAGPGEPPDVSLRDGARRRAELRIHRPAVLGRGDVARVEGIPVTTAARTLLDLAPGVGKRELEKALAEGLARGLVREIEIRKVVARHRGAPGARRLRTLVAAPAPGVTRSQAEERFLELVRRAQLDEPEVNATVDGLEVDFLWRRRGLIVEVDGFACHGAAGAFESDRRRDARLTASGFAVVRVTWQQMQREPTAVAVRVAQALVRPPRRSRPPRPVPAREDPGPRRARR